MSETPSRRSVKSDANGSPRKRPISEYITNLDISFEERCRYLRYIDDANSLENLLDTGVDPEDQADLKKVLRNLNLDPVTVQPSETLTPICPPGLDALLDCGQLVVHLANLRQNLVVDESCTNRQEVVDVSRKVVFHAEEDHSDLPTDSSFRYRLYNRAKQEIIQVYSPSSSTCVCWGASWHCLKRCRYQAIVYSPPGVVAGFVKRVRSKFIQEFVIMNANEEPLLVLRGGAQDLELYSLDLKDELGRLSVHGWVGIMHEIRRSPRDYGITFPIDLDVRVKAVLIGAVFALHWLYSTKGGKKKDKNRKK